MQKLKTSFDWADDTDQAVSTGELPEFAHSSNCFNEGESRALARMKARALAKETLDNKEAQQAKLWPGGGRWRVTKSSPLRSVMSADSGAGQRTS